MNPQLTVIRGISTLGVRKWAAEQMALPPVPGTVMPTPPAAVEPVQPPAVAEPLSDIAAPLPAGHSFERPMPKDIAAPATPPAPSPAVAPDPPAPFWEAAAKTREKYNEEYEKQRASKPPGAAAPGTLPPAAPVAAAPQSAAPAAAPGPAPASATSAKPNPMEQMKAKLDEANNTIDQQLGGPLDGLNEQAKQPATSWMGDMFSDWRNWAVPIGGLMTLFGGSTMKLLGGLIMGGGAVDLYQRYKGVEGLGSTPAGQQLVQQALTFKDAEGKPQPFGNLPQLMQAAPEQAQALKDFSLLARIGAKNQIAEKMVQAGVDRAATQLATTAGIPLNAETSQMAANMVIGRLQQTGKINDEQAKTMLANAKASAERLAAKQVPVAANG